ncbi:MAG TPA: group I intron-associated PD-(D/E)XK endonuclease [Patescibacteria group bacterium]|nr:group I intron-associated PD-(D/E)XK endonuclease [Patescibacteria group bacterium]
MNSKQKGSLAVAQCIAKLYLMGYEVLLPIGDRNAYDLVFDDGKELYKVQAKYAGLTSRGKCVAGLRITGGNQSYNYAKKYNNDAFDYLYIYTADNRHYLIQWKKIKVRNEISVNDKKYREYLI